ncbi:MAG TPA: ABC transporter permease [Vicinamibacterales bacterium]|nr:ABC transporter permease [Vicinamibacterales bacterium]
MSAHPRLANALLRLFVSDEDYEAIAGDFEEIYRATIAPRRHPLAARAWYWSQVVSVAAAVLVARLRPYDEPASFPTERNVMTAVRQDLSYAWRGLRRQPGFTFVAVITLALGIGANVAIFSLVNAVVLKPLPFADPDRLMAVHLVRPDADSPGISGQIVWSYPKYEVFRESQRVFESTTLFMPDEWNITGSDAPERVNGEWIEAAYLATLGISPQIGRSFAASETKTPASAPIVMLGHGFWMRRFGGDSTAIGQTLGLNGTPHTIVGVLPPSFHGLSGRTDIWVPLMTKTAGDLGEAYNHSYWLVARRRADVSVDQARAAVQLLGAQVNERYAPGGMNAGRPAWGATAVPLDDERVDPIVRRSLLLMLAAVAAVLLIVCLNLANLMMVRGLGRQREVAIRHALGASRVRIVRLMMTESLLLAAAGAAAGVAVAVGLVTAGASLLPDLSTLLQRQTGGLTRVGLATLGVDINTLLFTIAMTMTTAVLFGLAPAWRTARRDLTAAMRDGGATSHPSAGLSFRNMLIVGEVALALLLLAAGGLMLKSVSRLQAADLGFNPASLLTVGLTMPGEQYDAARATQLLTSLVDRLGASGQIGAVAYGSCAPLSGGCNGTTVKFPNRPAPPGTPSQPVGVIWVSPSYFDTLGVSIVRGRAFTDRDRVGQPKVVVVNESAARVLWKGQDPIGQRISLGQGGFQDGAEVVGIVRDVRYGAIERTVAPDVYIPLFQSTRRGGVIFVRGRVSPEASVAAIRAEVHALDPDLPLTNIKMMDDRFGDATWRTRMSAWLLGAFSTLALMLAAVGIYGVVSQTVAQRSRELGVRVALGASGADIVRLVLSRVCLSAIAGIALGVAVAVPLLRGLTALLYEVRPGDPIVLSSLAIMMLLVAVAAAYVPARRASRADPLAALRD